MGFWVCDELRWSGAGCGAVSGVVCVICFGELKANDINQQCEYDGRGWRGGTVSCDVSVRWAELKWSSLRWNVWDGVCYNPKP